eukprot:gene9522-biopygen665
MPHRAANEGGVVALRVQQAGTGGCEEWGALDDPSCRRGEGDPLQNPTPLQVHTAALGLKNHRVGGLV